MAVGKGKLVDAIVADNPDLKKKEVAVVIDSLLKAIVEQIADGETITIPGFGRFKSAYVKERPGTNPANPAKKIVIPGHVKVSFKAGSEFYESVNKPDVVEKVKKASKKDE